MKSEAKLYQENLSEFEGKLQDLFFQNIGMEEDLDPTFNLSSLPFQAKYCYSLLLFTENTAFRIIAMQTANGMNTLWFEENKSEKPAISIIAINERCKSFSWKSGHEDLPFRFRIKFESISISVYAAEIYNQNDGSLRFVMNDEMLLVFDSEVEAAKFESQIDYA